MFLRLENSDIEPGRGMGVTEKESGSRFPDEKANGTSARSQRPRHGYGRAGGEDWAGER